MKIKCTEPGCWYTWVGPSFEAVAVAKRHSFKHDQERAKERDRQAKRFPKIVDPGPAEGYDFPGILTRYRERMDQMLYGESFRHSERHEPSHGDRLDLACSCPEELLDWECVVHAEQADPWTVR